jgi:glycosyltransferase involved in cell wall biosynthesis
MSFRIASLSRLSVERGIAELIQAIPLIKHDVDCYIGGDGPLSFKNKLAEICDQFDLKSKVHFVGTITSPSQFLKDKMLVINPILIKTGQEYGASDMEVLLNKKALIRSWDKTQNILKHDYNVYCINPVPKEIAAAVDYLIDNIRLRRLLEENGYKTARRIQEMAIKQHYTFYKTLLNRRK